MRIRNLDCDDGDECDIRVFIPGPSGPPLIDVGTFLLPIVITASVPVPLLSNGRWQRMFIQASAPIAQLIVPSPPDNGAWLIGLQVVGGSPIVLNNDTNIKLSGEWPAAPDSLLWLLWDGNSRYVESGRNEIF